MTNAVVPYPDLRAFFCIGGSGTSVTTIANNTDKIAFVRPIPSTGTITHVGFATGTVTTAAPISVRVETIAGNNPTGTLYHANATGEVATPASNTYYRVPLNGGDGFPATRGDMVAIVMSCPSGSPNLGILRQVGAVQSIENYIRVFTGSWAAANGLAPTSIEYAGGVVPFLGIPPLNNYPTTRSFNLNSTGTVTGDEAGVQFTLPFSGRAVGFRVAANLSAACELRLYSGTTLIEKSRTIATNEYVAELWRTTHVPLLSDVTLAPGTYIVALRPTTTSNVGLPECPVPEAGYQRAYGFQPADGVVTRVDLGAWQPVDTTRLFPMALEFDQIDIGGAGRGRPVFYGV